MKNNDGPKELELIDFLSILYNKKWIIASITLATVLITVPILFSMPKQYRANMIINTRTLKTQDGQVVPIDKPENIIELVESGTFISDILDRIDGSNRNFLKFTTSHQKGAFSIDIAYDTSEPEYGLKVLDLLSEKLKERYEKTVKSIYDNVDYKIQMLNLEIILNKKKFDAENINADNLEMNFISNQKLSDNIISLKKREIELSKLKIDDFNNKTNNIKNQIKYIMRNASPIETNPSNPKSLSGLDKDLLLKWLIDKGAINIYELTKNLYDSLSETNQRIYEEQILIASAKSMINNELVNKEIKKREYEDNKAEHQNKLIEFNQQQKLIELNKSVNANIKRDTSNLEILQPPKTTKNPVKPRKKIILIIVMMTVLMATTFIIMLQEYIKRSDRSAVITNP